MAEKIKNRNRALFFLALYLYTLTSAGLFLKLSIFAVLWYITGGREWIDLVLNTWRRDARLISRGAKILALSLYVRLHGHNAVTMFRKVVEQFPEKAFLINQADGKSWTYREVDRRSNQIAHYFLAQGFRKGQVVAFFMENRPEYVITWLGLAKIGVVPALINYNLRSSSLKHTIAVASCTAIIYGQELEKAVNDVYSDLVAKRGFFPAYFSKSSCGLPEDKQSLLEDAVDMDAGVDKSSKEPEPESVASSIGLRDPLLYIYTSGTTGLPKAVNVTHFRQMTACFSPYFGAGLCPDDILYGTLPLYHSSGGQVTLGGGLFFGCTTVIRRKFSASNFTKDCCKYNVTAANYIGEICRYLMMSPPSQYDRAHKLRLMYGNGLRATLWEDFTKRFGIKDIAEFYGSTEGNANTINIMNRVGAVGSIHLFSPIRQLFQPQYVIKVDQDTMEPIRSDDGFCIEADPDEPGEFIGKIVKGDPMKEFVGYKDGTATTKKTIANVFKSGDLYFRSGDILSMDKYGWLTFKDRVGDTFRWKGENVSTNEVEATVTKILGQKDATSYGVEIPGTEGRAGMVAIPAKSPEDLDLNHLASGIGEKLPSYARPMFLRLVKEVDLTSTYKLKKNVLQSQAFNMEKIKDPMFFMDQQTRKYVPLTQELYTQIMTGALRL